MKRLLLFIGFVVLFVTSLSGQVSFTSLPMDRQLVARDLVSNNGTVIIQGIYDRTGANPNYSAIRVRVFKNGNPHDVVTQSLSYGGNNQAIFDFGININAELSKYSFEIYGVLGGSEDLLDLPNDANNVLDDIVAGDVYIIQGQSNAEAIMYDGSSNANLNDYIRVYARGTHDENVLWGDDSWYYGQGDGSRSSAGNTGQWGIRLANKIVTNNNIPVAIFNGARGGRGIGYFKSDYAGVLEPGITNNYSRLLYRLDTTNLSDKVRAVFWSQGENTQEYDNYYNELQDLMNDWLTDYPNIEKFFIFQTDNNCNEEEDYIDKVMDVKEAQRLMAVNNPDVEIMTTAALNHHGSCHFYFSNGYEAMGDRIYELVDRDLYGASGLIDRAPPMILDAYLTTPTNLVVETDAASLSGNNPTEDFFLLENAGGAQILDIQVSGSNFVITLDQDPGLTANLTYRGPYLVETGNFITNSQNLELVSFKSFPIGTDIDYGQEIMITQYYEGSNNSNRWIEIKNISGAIIPANRYYLALYNSGSNLNNITTQPPARSVAIVELGVDETLLYRRSSATLPSLANLGDATVIVNGVCNFSGNDVLLISTENDATCYANRYDIIGELDGSNWGRDKGFVRGDDAVPELDFVIGNWFELTEDEVNDAISNTNVALGTQDTGTPVWDGSAWSNLIVPDRTRDVLLSNSYSADNGTLITKNLQVTGDLDFDRNSTKSIVVYGDLTINGGGSVTIGDQESLVMYDPNAVITGTVAKYEKSTFRNNTHDFTYWSSPMENQSLSTVFSGVNPNRIFWYDQLQSDVVDSYLPWLIATGQMEPGVGYAAEGVATSTGVHDITFTGTPNNGDISVVLKRFNDSEPDNDFNLIGNPYPSAIDLRIFFSENSNIDHVVYLWTHNTPITNGNSGDFVADDYALVNSSGGVAAGSGGVKPDFNMASGQGFFVRAINNGTVTFKNNMRLIEQNDLFFKNSKSKKRNVAPDDSEIEDKIWLNLTTDNGGFSQILIGFMQGLSNGVDLGYDARKFNRSENPISFYSIIAGDKYTIQSQRAYEKSRKIKLGFDTNVAPRKFTVSIDKVQGALLGSKIYLVDKLLKTKHDLTASAYDFHQTTVGEFKNRFVLTFDGKSDSEETEPTTPVNRKKLSVYRDNRNELYVRSNSKIVRAIVYDIYGNKLYVGSPNSKDFVLQTSSFGSRKVLLFEATYNDGEVLRKKFLNLQSNGAN